MKVRATKLGYYDLIRRREGDVFELKPIETVDFEAIRAKLGNVRDADAREAVRRNPEAKWPKRIMTVDEQFSSVWMERVDPATPEKHSTAQQSIQRQHDEIASGRAPKSSRAA